jgi:PAS domain S-box-containing protein
MRGIGSLAKQMFQTVPFADVWKSLPILFGGLLITGWIGITDYKQAEKQSDAEFSKICNEIQAAITERLQTQALLLESAAAFIESSDTVTSQEWQTFFSHLGRDSALKWIQGVGYAVLIDRSSSGQLVNNRQIREDVDFNKSERSKAPAKAVPVYMEPATGLNPGPVGQDLFSEPAYRRALELSRDSNWVSLSDAGIRQAEVSIMCCPVFRDESSKGRLRPSQGSIKGWVYSPLDIKYLLSGILSPWNALNNPGINLHIFQDSLFSQSVFSSSQDIDNTIGNYYSAKEVFRKFVFNGKQWFLKFSEVSKKMPPNQSKMLIVLIGGALISLLLFILVLSWFNIRKQSVRIEERLKAELKSSESRFEKIFSEHGSAMLLLNPVDGKIFYANNSAADFYGYSISGLTKMSIRDFQVFNDDSGQQKTGIAADASKRSVISTHRLASGRERVVEIHSTPVEYKKMKLVFSVIHDITDRAQAEKEVSLQRQIMDGFFDVNLDLLCIADLDGNFLRVNNEWEKVLGYSKDILLQRKFLEFVHPDDMDATLDAIRKLGENKDVFNFINRYRCRDGQYRFIEWRSTPHGNLIYAAARDITDRKLIEEALRESETRLRLTIESSKVGTWDWDIPTGKVIFNRYCAEMLGYSLEDVDQHISYWEKLTHPDDLPELKEILAGHLSGKSDFYKTDHRVKTNSGGWKWVMDRGKTIRWDDQGNPLQITGTRVDITEIKEVQEHLTQLNQQLQQITATKEKLFSIIAHDLRSPFNSILGISGMVSENPKDFNPERLIEMMNVIHSTAERTLILLENLLEWTRSQTQQIDPDHSGFQLESLIQNVIQGFSSSALAKNISVTYTLSDNCLLVADLNMVQTVLRNLVSNAIKFTHRGGQVHIHAESIADKCEITVSDTGIGLNMDALERLFRIETNQSSAGTDNEKGSGLGLILCKEFVEKLGGHIWVESQPGRGSEFKFTLPSSNIGNTSGSIEKEKMDR